MHTSNHSPRSFQSLLNSINANWLLALLVIITPLIVTGLVVTLHLRANFSNYVPTFGSDPVGYWHYTLTFSHAGFNGGYYTPNEVPAPFTLIHFDVIGPFQPILYGTVAHFTGWSWATGVIFNAVLITAAMLLVVVTLRPDRTQLFFMGLIAGTSWVLILFLPSMFQESFHFAVGITAAAAFYALLHHPQNVSRFTKVLFGFVIILVALVRPSWCVLLLPYIIFATPSKSRWAIVGAFVKTAVITIIMLQLLKYISPPSNNSVLDSAAGFQNGLLTGFTKVFTLFATNIVWYSVDGRNYPLNLMVVSQVVGILLVQMRPIMPVRLARLRFRFPKQPFSGETILHLSNLGGIAVSGMFLYLAWGFERVFSPHLLLSAFLLIAFRRYRLVAALVVTNVLFMGAFLTTFSQYWATDFSANPAEFAAQQAEVSPYIVYDPDASNAWCNTLLMDVRLFDSRVLSIPAGIGVSYVLKTEKLQFPLKSRYLLFDSLLDLDLYKTLQPQLNVQQIAQLSIGDLYINQDAACS